MPAEEVERLAAMKVSDLGRYRLIAELARGGMGVVYLALVRGPGGFNKLFVVKELKPHLAEDPNLVEMFLEEARLAAKLNHPNVVQTIEVGSDRDRPYIAMEHLDGQSLNRISARARKVDSPLPMPHFLFILAHMLEGLHYAHHVTDFDGTPLNIVHRDVSPHNVFVTYEGHVKVVDFGIAKALDSSNETRAGVLKGKIAYMAPEQAVGARPDRRADVFAAGVMLFEAAVGQRMWAQAENDLQILHALTSKKVPRPRDVKPEIDPRLEQIILRATAVEVDDRYPDAAEMREDIEAYLRAASAPALPGRDIGRFVSGLFTAERARIKLVVDEQLRLLRGVGSGEHAQVDLALLTPPSTFPASGTPSGVLVNEQYRAPIGEIEAPAPTSATQWSRLSSAGATPAAAAAPAARSRMPVVLAAAGLGVFVAGAGAALLLRSSAPAPTPVAPSASAPAAQARPSASAPAPARIHAHITATPSDAQITIDDGAPQKGPIDLTFARDGGKQHTLRIQAAQHETKTLTFTADDDKSFDVSLEATKAPAPTQPAPRAGAWAAPPRSPTPAQTQPATPPPQAVAPSAPVPAPTASGHRQVIDTSDPYAH